MIRHRVRYTLPSGRIAICDPVTRVVLKILPVRTPTTRPPDHITLRLHQHYTTKFPGRKR